VEGHYSEESDHLRFLRAAGLATLKGSVGLILAEASALKISIPIMKGLCNEKSFENKR
jgi:hypothetical protein